MLFMTFGHQAIAFLALLASALFPYALLLGWTSPTPFSKCRPPHSPNPYYYSLPATTVILILMPFPHSIQGWAQIWGENSLAALRVEGQNHTRIYVVDRVNLFPSWWLWNINFHSLKTEAVDLNAPLKMLKRTWTWQKLDLTSNTSVAVLWALLYGATKRKIGSMLSICQKFIVQ